jgi:transcription elongation factor
MTDAPLVRGPGSHRRSDGSAKAGYATRKAAEQAARRARGEGGPRLWAYRCASECNAWHLTGSPRRTAL